MPDFQKVEPLPFFIYSRQEMLEMIYSVICSQQGPQTNSIEHDVATKIEPMNSEINATSEKPKTPELYEAISIKSEEVSYPEELVQHSGTGENIFPPEDQFLTVSLQKNSMDVFNKLEDIEIYGGHGHIDGNASDVFYPSESVPANNAQSANTINNPFSDSMSEMEPELENTEESDWSQTETPLTPVRCTEENCNSYFVNVEKMQRHVHAIHKVEKPYTCTQCPKRYTHNHNLKAHIRKVHDKKSFYHSCSYCEKLFENKDDLTLHFSNSHQEPNPFNCGFCPQIFENRDNLVNHTNICHPRVYIDERRKLSCSQCHKKCSSKRSLNRHLQTVHKQEKGLIKYSCNICGKNYASKEEVMLHYNAHQEHNPFQCVLCPELYTNREDLKQHVTNAHPDPAGKRLKYKCDICDKSFTAFASVKLHCLKKHEDQNNFSFKCSLCDMKFAYKGLLKLHMVSHNESKVECDVCGNWYRSCGLMAHKIDKHIEKSYKCRFCPTTIFGTRYKLVTHERRHKKM